MCAVSLHAGASSRSVSALYDWNYLAAAPCVLISMSNAYCYEVSWYCLMVVRHGVVKTSSTLFGGGEEEAFGTPQLILGEQAAFRDQVLPQLEPHSPAVQAAGAGVCGGPI